jgi:hypothetical protein
MNKRAFLGLMAAWMSFSAAGPGCKPVERTFTGTGGQTTGTGGAGGTGGGGACQLGDLVDCYDGPAGTEGKGVCVGGKAVCGADGKLGACTGEVVPAAQVDCTAHQDQDCDGNIDRCPLDTLWAKAYAVAGGGGFAPPAVAVDPSGNIFFAGFLTGQLDFGITTLVSASGDADAFVAKVDAAGTTLWAKKFGDPMKDQVINNARSDADGNVILVGFFQGSLDDLGIVVPPAAGGTDAFVIKLDPSGTPLWARWGGDTGYQSADAVAVTPAGDVVVAGRYDGSFSFNGGGGTFSNTVNNGDVIFVQRFDKDGNAVWNTSLATDPANGYGDEQIYSITTDLNGDVLVAGYFEGNVVFPDGTSHLSAGGYDIFVTKLNGKSGAVLWAKTFGGTTDEQNYGVAADTQGSVFITGSFQDTLTMGNQTVTPMDAQKNGLYLAKLTPAGEPSWLKGFGCGTNAAGLLVEVAENNDLILVGAFDGTIDFGGGPLTAQITAQGAAAGFLAKLDGSGNHLGSRAFSPSADPNNASVLYTFRAGSVPVTHEIVTAGLAVGQFDLGTGPLGASMIGGPFLAKFAP